MFFERSRSDTMTIQPHVSLCRLQPSRDNVEQRRAFRSCTKIITRKLNHNLRARKKLTGSGHDADHVAAPGLQIDRLQHPARAFVVMHVPQLEIG